MIVPLQEKGASLPWRVERENDSPKLSDDDVYRVKNASGRTQATCYGKDARETAVLIAESVNLRGEPICANCGKPAACFGSYETELTPAFACDECCAHGNEDGHCEPIAPRVVAQSGKDGGHLLSPSLYGRRNPLSLYPPESNSPRDVPVHVKLKFTTPSHDVAMAHRVKSLFEGAKFARILGPLESVTLLFEDQWLSVLVVLWAPDAVDVHGRYVKIKGSGGVAITLDTVADIAAHGDAELVEAMTDLILRAVLESIRHELAEALVMKDGTRPIEPHKDEEKGL